MTAAKTSYTISCASAFRDAVMTLAQRRQVNAGDLARSVLLLVPEGVIDASPDPGEPPSDDRETVALTSGRLAGRTMRRKPRLQVRLPAGIPVLRVRKALSLALALDAGTMALGVNNPAAPAPVSAPEPPPPPPVPSPAPSPTPVDTDALLAPLREEVERLKAVVSALAFDPLPHGVTSRSEALHVLGFPPEADPDTRELRSRFRLLATIHHPDSSFGDHDRMAQLNAAMDLLRRGL